MMMGNPRKFTTRGRMKVYERFGHVPEGQSDIYCEVDWKASCATVSEMQKLPQAFFATTT